MAKGTKIELNIGSNFEDEWNLVQEKQKKAKQKILSPKEHRLYFKFEKRAGKPVTLIGPIYLENNAVKTLLKKIKKSLGSGGSFKNCFMEFQGDCKERLKKLFIDNGFSFKNKNT